jgi:hypothetical protein
MLAEHPVGKLQQFSSEFGMTGPVRFLANPDQEIDAALSRLQLPAPDFSDSPPQTIAGHRGGLELRYDQSHPRVARQVVGPDEFKVQRAPAPATVQASGPVSIRGKAT